jgi:hypothetical protein
MASSYSALYRIYRSIEFSIEVQQAWGWRLQLGNFPITPFVGGQGRVPADLTWRPAVRFTREFSDLCVRLTREFFFRGG